jgi:hypothetical protein
MDTLSSDKLKEAISSSVLLLLLLGLPLIRSARYLVETEKEKISSRKQRFKLKPGYIYLASKPESIRKTKRIFSDYVHHDRLGLYFTWESTDEITDELTLNVTTVIRFSDDPQFNELGPHISEDLTMIPMMVEDVAIEEGEGIVLLEGLDKIVRKAGLRDARDMFVKLRQIAECWDLPIIIIADENKLGKRKMKFFEKNVKKI